MIPHIPLDHAFCVKSACRGDFRVIVPRRFCEVGSFRRWSRTGDLFLSRHQLNSSFLLNRAFSFWLTRLRLDPVFVRVGNLSNPTLSGLSKQLNPVYFNLYFPSEGSPFTFSGAGFKDTPFPTDSRDGNFTTFSLPYLNSSIRVIPVLHFSYRFIPNPQPVTKAQPGFPPSTNYYNDLITGMDIYPGYAELV